MPRNGSTPIWSDSIIGKENNILIAKIKNIKKENLLNTESNVSERYAKGAIEVQESLCCPVDYDAALLKILPKEIVDKITDVAIPLAMSEKGTPSWIWAAEWQDLLHGSAAGW